MQIQWGRHQAALSPERLAFRKVQVSTGSPLPASLAVFLQREARVQRIEHERRQEATE